jgi:hypothetical protein
VGWQKEGDRLGAVILVKEMTPGGEYSGCPGSISRTITLDHGLFFEPPRSVMNRFASSRPNVDFPEDFGPQRKIAVVPFRFAGASPDNFLFHSAGETSSCRAALLETSSEV